MTREQNCAAGRVPYDCIEPPRGQRLPPPSGDYEYAGISCKEEHVQVTGLAELS